MSNSHMELEALIAERRKYVETSVRLLSTIIESDLKNMDTSYIQTLHASWGVIFAQLKEEILRRAKEN